MADEWFYARDGQKHGPLSPPDLKRLSTSGQLLPTDLIWKQGMAQWVPAGSVKQLFAGASPETPSGVLAEPGIPFPGPPKNTPSAPAVGFRKRAAEAARCARATAERTQLVNVTLPRAYAELGKVKFNDATCRGEFAEVFSQIEHLLSQRNRIQEECKARPAGTTLADKAKKAAADAAALARQKAIDLQVYQAYSKLGEAVYQRHGNGAGPAAVTQPISTAIAKRDELDEELSVMAFAAKGRWLTPKRLALAAAGFIALTVVFGGLQLFSTGDSGFRNRLMGEWKSDSGLTLTFHSGSVVAAGEGDSFKTPYTVRPASKQVLFKLTRGSETRSFSGTLEDDSLQLESSHKGSEVLIFTRVAKPTRNGGSSYSADDGGFSGSTDGGRETGSMGQSKTTKSRSPRSGSAMFKNGYQYGLQAGREHRRSLESTHPRQRAGILEIIKNTKMGFNNELKSCDPRQTQHIDLARGKLDGYEAGLNGE